MAQRSSAMKWKATARQSDSQWTQDLCMWHWQKVILDPRKVEVKHNGVVGSGILELVYRITHLMIVHHEQCIRHAVIVMGVLPQY